MPKVKDFVNKPTMRYNEIYKAMGQSPKKDMKDELTNFLKTLKQSSHKKTEPMSATINQYHTY